MHNTVEVMSISHTHTHTHTHTHAHSPNFKVAYITFATDSIVHLNLTRTADRYVYMPLQNFFDYTAAAVIHMH